MTDTRMWSVRGEPRTIETFGDPHRDDFRGFPRGVPASCTRCGEPWGWCGCSAPVIPLRNSTSREEPHQ